MITYDEILPRLNNPKPDSKGVMFFCPSHPDGQKQNRRSARTWRRMDGSAGVKCFAGCQPRDILQALGFDLSNNGNGERRQEPETAYGYRDKDGKLLYQVVRGQNKNFRQRRPDGRGDWIWDMRGIERTLYRLPETLEAVQKGETVYVVEGEKDCNNLVRLGLVATTNSGGAGKWEARFADYLAGADVVILPDNDEPGRKHADQVAWSLQSKAKSIKAVELSGLPDKGDVSDWLAAGGTKERLLQIVAEAPEWTGNTSEDKKLFEPVTVRLSDVESEEVSYLWEPYIPLGKLTILEGDPGIGKTYIALAMAAAVTTGAGLPGQDGKPGPRRAPSNVVYMTAEDGLGDTLRPRLDAIGADCSRVFALTGYIGYDPDTNDKTELPVTMKNLLVLDQALEKHKPALLVIDPLQAFLGAGVDMHRANETRPVLAGVAGLAEKHGCAVLLIRHLGKSQQDRVIYRGLGSIDFTAAARSVILAGQDPDNPTSRALIHTKSSLSPVGASVGYEIRDGQFLWAGLSELTASKVLRPEQEEGETSALDDAKEFIQDLLDGGPVTAKEVEKQRRGAGISERTLNRAKSDLKIKSVKQGETWYWSKGTYDGKLGKHDSEPCATRDSEDESSLPYGNVGAGLESHAAQETQEHCQVCQDKYVYGGVL